MFGEGKRWVRWLRQRGLLRRGRSMRIEGRLLVLSFDYERGFAGEDLHAADEGLARALELLRDCGARATFNCVAKISLVAPQRIAEILAAGHEVACHGYEHESPRDLPDEALDRMLANCVEAFGQIGHRPRGFRSPRSHWDRRLLQRLAPHGFAYSAEHDAAPAPYALSFGDASLWRMPIATDDWDDVRHPGQSERVSRDHLNRLHRRFARHTYLALGYHPWLLAGNPHRVERLKAMIRQAMASGVRMCAFDDLLGEDTTFLRASRSAEEQTA
ncbi:MAG: polysaccharide deacetylase family protein [Phycisphaerae bacterium]|nr:polysaccharide deacetylase family protein [Phycisphaerae bacterium]